MTEVDLHADDAWQVVRRFYAAINAGLIDDAVALVTDDFVGHGVGGREGLRAELAMWAGAFPDLEFVIDETVVERDRVAVRLRVCGTHTGTFAGIPASNRAFEVRATDLVRVVDGKVAEAWPLYDLAALLVQVGTPLTVPEH